MIQMFEKYMIVENDAANIVENGKITGFKFGARLPYYRGKKRWAAKRRTQNLFAPEHANCLFAFSFYQKK